MKNEKALEILSDLTVDYENRTPDEIAELDEALDMAINSLKCIASAPLHFSNKDYELGHTTGYKKGYTTGYKKGYKDAYLENQLSQSGTNDEDRTEDDQISRRAAVDAVEWGITYARAINTCTGETKELFRVSNCALNEAAERIKKLPPAQPEPQSRMVFGYPLEYLVAFAEACRRAGVDESDLKTFANNCEFAYATMEEEHRQHINQAIEAFMGKAGGANASD